MITLSINPTYLCNFRCDFCYLSREQLGDPTRLDIPTLDHLLDHVTTYTPVKHVDIYGGEVAVLPADYYRQMIASIRRKYTGTINVVTNYSRITPHLWEDPNVTISVSYDFSHRERHEQVLANIRNSPVDVHMLILATSGVVGDDVTHMIDVINQLDRVTTVEIKPYSSNQCNTDSVTDVDYERFVQRWITSPQPKRFAFINEQRLQGVFSGQTNPFSNDHLYITPQGTLAVLDFDLNDNEYFRTVANYDEYIRWAQDERNRTFANPFCSQCQYLGRCLTEHLREVRSLEHSCNGHQHLITWYQRERMESTAAPVSQDR